MLFCGANQTKVPFEIAATLQKLGPRAEYVKIAGSGPNALDFHIAYYVGYLAADHPGAFFHIISRDKGFDPLIQHLKSKKILAIRSESIADIPLVKNCELTFCSQMATFQRCTKFDVRTPFRSGSIDFGMLERECGLCPA